MCGSRLASRARRPRPPARADRVHRNRSCDPGHVPTPPRPQTGAARPALPQEPAAPFFARRLVSDLPLTTRPNRPSQAELRFAHAGYVDPRSPDERSEIRDGGQKESRITLRFMRATLACSGRITMASIANGRSRRVMRNAARSAPFDVLQSGLLTGRTSASPAEPPIVFDCERQIGDKGSPNGPSRSDPICRSPARSLCWSAHDKSRWLHRPIEARGTRRRAENTAPPAWMEEAFQGRGERQGQLNWRWLRS